MINVINKTKPGPVLSRIIRTRECLVEALERITYNGVNREQIRKTLNTVYAPIETIELMRNSPKNVRYVSRLLFNKDEKIANDTASALAFAKHEGVDLSPANSNMRKALAKAEADMFTDMFNPHFIASLTIALGLERKSTGMSPEEAEKVQKAITANKDKGPIWSLGRR